MAQLSSPGVSVSVIDESFYTPAAAGTTPLIFVTSAQDKQNSAGTGTAPGTLQANAGKVYLLTSQKDLADTFGTPVFKTDASNNPVHAGEQNEFGLQAAYSYLGVSNRAYVVRADCDLNQLDATPDAPAGDPVDSTYWLDTSTSAYGIFEWNNASSSTGGQTFTVVTPSIITDATKTDVDPVTGPSPKASFGAIGDYAVIATTNVLKAWYKKGQTNTGAGWVAVGSSEWVASRPTAKGTVTSPSIIAGDELIINGTTITGATNLAGLVADINAGSDGNPDDDNNSAIVAGVTAAVVNGRIELYSTGTDITLSGSLVAKLGLGMLQADGSTDLTPVWPAPALAIAPHTSVPQFKATGDNRPTGSVWVKTTNPNGGANWKVKKYNASTKAFVTQTAPLYANGPAALYGLDKVGGGINLALGATYVKYNVDGQDPSLATFSVYARQSVGAMVARTIKFSGSSLAFTADISETVTGQDTIGAFSGTDGAWEAIDPTDSGVGSKPIVVGAGADGEETATKLAEAINTAGLVNVIAVVNSDNSVSISHKLGGDIRIVGTGANAALVTDSFVFYDADTGANVTSNVVDLGDDAVYASSWRLLNEYVLTLDGPGYAQSASAPTTTTADSQLWYNSIVDEVDIMVHNGTKWVGYRNYSATAADKSQYATSTDVTTRVGYTPIVSATKPAIAGKEDGDLWIDTSDLENYPTIYKFNKDQKKWILVDKSDQTTEDGILFHDARWATTGAASEASTIEELANSNFVDFDAPDPALYPRGMLLWNLRRSGFNVKRFVQNYVDINAENDRYKLAGVAQSMALYYPHRWVSEAANEEDGSGTFGRKAQRKVVVQKLQALVNANQDIRDEESRVFNLIACPGYSELVGEMVSLNYDRGLTAFVVADTPARLTPDATTMSNWGNNQAGALEDNDKGLVSSDEYLGFFYPWGFTSDNIGNNIAVPPSHMILRTIALNDQVAYPWFAPAGTRRGGITNATAVGYITAEGEFQSVALNNGQRDTMASIKVNPITFITGTGLVNYGQYTRAKNASALDRINVARLVIYLRRQFAQLAKPYVFEPNDKITRDEIKGAAESLLLELVGQRALYDYLVVCDESNNTPSRIDRNELYLDVAIEPVKAVEFIYIPLRLKNTGEIKGLA
jgi:hypothetical protein